MASGRSTCFAAFRRKHIFSRAEPRQCLTSDDPAGKLRILTGIETRLCDEIRGQPIERPNPNPIFLSNHRDNSPLQFLAPWHFTMSTASTSASRRRCGTMSYDAFENSGWPIFTISPPAPLVGVLSRLTAPEAASIKWQTNVAQLCCQ